MTIEEQPIMFEAQAQPVSWVFRSIAFFYIAEVILSIFLGGFSSIGASSGLSAVYSEEVYLMFGLLILAAIEAFGIFKRQSWARMFGIMLGVLLLAPGFLGFYTHGASLQLTLVFFFVNPLNIIIMLAIGCFILPKWNRDWENRGWNAIVIAIVLSVIGFVLVFTNIQNYHEIVKPFREAQDASDSARVNGNVKAGTVYTDAIYGFQLAFPVDVAFSKLNEDTIDFGPAYKQLMFNVSIYDASGIYESLESFVFFTNKEHPSTRVVKRGAIHNTPFVEFDFDSDGQSFAYVIIHNGKFFYFTNFSGVASSQFDQVMQTLNFSN